jgi:hypothetical protein
LPYYFGNLDLNSLVLDGWSAEYNEWAFKFPCPAEPPVIVAIENPPGSTNRIFTQKFSTHRYVAFNIYGQ